MIDFNIDLKWVFGAIGAIIAFVIFRIKIHNAKQSGRDEIIRDKIDLDLKKLIEIHKEKQRILDENRQSKNCVPDNWNDIDTIVREKGHSTLSNIADSDLCQNVRTDSESNKTSKPASND